MRLGLEKVRGTSLNTSLGKMPSAYLVGGEPRCPGPWMPARMPLRQASVCLGRAVPLPHPPLLGPDLGRRIRFCDGTPSLEMACTHTHTHTHSRI